MLCPPSAEVSACPSENCSDFSRNVHILHHQDNMSGSTNVNVSDLHLGSFDASED